MVLAKEILRRVENAMCNWWWRNKMVNIPQTLMTVHRWPDRPKYWYKTSFPQNRYSNFKCQITTYNWPHGYVDINVVGTTWLLSVGSEIHWDWPWLRAAFMQQCHDSIPYTGDPTDPNTDIKPSSHRTDIPIYLDAFWRTRLYMCRFKNELF